MFLGCSNVVFGLHNVLDIVVQAHRLLLCCQGHKLLALYMLVDNFFLIGCCCRLPAVGVPAPPFLPVSYGPAIPHSWPLPWVVPCTSAAATARPSKRVKHVTSKSSKAS
jgi:hypothetical protein